MILSTQVLSILFPMIARDFCAALVWQLPSNYYNYFLYFSLGSYPGEG